MTVYWKGGIIGAGLFFFFVPVGDSFWFVKKIKHKVMWKALGSENEVITDK